MNGLLPHDAGKTSVVRAILNRASREGRRVAGFKPMSSHNYWEHYDHSQTCESLGTLVSRDVLLFRDAMEEPPEVELLNPYHQVVCPLDWAKALEAGDHYLNEERPRILAERLSSPDEGTTFFANKRAELFVAPTSFVEAVQGDADRVVPFQTSPVAEGLAQVEVTVQAAFGSLLQGWEDLVVESFSDIALPLSLDQEELDVVISVGGSLVLFTEPAELARVHGIVQAPRTIRLLKYLKPAEVFRVPHLGSSQREELDDLGQAYGEVLDALWARL